MQGYFGRLSPPAFPEHFGSLSFSTDGTLEKKDGAFLVLEGHLLGLRDTQVPFDRDQPLRTLLALYEVHGEAFVSHLDGYFLLLFRPSGEKDSPAFLVNNRHQACRLYYADLPDGLHFSPSLKELLSRTGMSRQPHFGSIRCFLSNGFTWSDQTQIRDVYKLLPADYFVFLGDKAEKKTYWPGEMKFDRKPFADLDSHLNEYERIYRRGLDRYLSAAKPASVGALLSGGHDTSFLVAQAAQVWKKPLHTYTVTFPGWAFDEGVQARNVAKKFRTQHHPVPFEPRHLDRMLSLILANEEPVVGSSLPLHVLAEEASGEVGVLLGGDGGDTLWAEYHPVAEYHRWTYWMPRLARQGLWSAAHALRNLTDWERFWELEHVAALFKERDYHDDFLRRLCTYRHFGDQVQNSLLRPELLRVPPSRSHLEVPFTDKNFSDALIEGKLYHGFLTYQAFHTTKLVEYNGMELFLPTIEKDVMDFICALPREWVNGGGPLHRLSNGKKYNRRFHKQALSRYFQPGEIYNRSFDIPWYNILRPRKTLLDRLLARLQRRGWYQEEALSQLFREFMTQTVKDHELLELKHHGYRIFTLLSLEIWCIEYLDGRFSADEKNLVLEDYLA